ncbi:hypothetical protein HD554DRAFT_1671908 [Boletus coccyginus]|nr:hypothetical protein HD554DRAFT_1671908 [Boletus coccyginus]
MAAQSEDDNVPWSASVAQHPSSPTTRPFPTIFINMAHHTPICLCTCGHPPLSFCCSAPLYVTFTHFGFVGFLIGSLLPGALLLYCSIDIFRYGPRLARTWLAWGWQTICTLYRWVVRLTVITDFLVSTSEEILSSCESPTTIQRLVFVSWKTSFPLKRMLDDVHPCTTFIIRKDSYYPCCGTISCHCNAAHAYTSRVSPGSVGSKYILSNHT